MKELIYPHFLKCIEFTDDIFWKNIFEELAFGIPPYNTFIRKHCLICNIKGKEFNYHLNKINTPKTTFVEIYNVLYNKLGLLSDIQIKEEELNFENQNKKKVLKHSIIEEFSNRMGERYNFTLETIKRLINHINLSLIIKNNILDDIEYDDNGYIKKIDGIIFKKGGFQIKSVYITNYVNNDSIIDYEYMYNHWTKYISTLIK